MNTLNSIHKLVLFISVICFVQIAFAGDSGIGPFEEYEMISDTIPIQDRLGDFITDEYDNPFDILPSNIEQSVEYDPESNLYIISEKIGDEFYKYPSYLTFEEYLEWKTKKQEREYFERLGGVGDSYKTQSGILDPIAKLDIQENLVNRLFGGEGVTIKPQGQIDMFIGMDYQKIENPALTIDQQRQGPFLEPDLNIQMNVDGKIGDKLDLGFNYNTQATFNFDQKIKLEYDSEQFSEDDIIKKIEAGNVSLPLRSNLIQGAQSLFGLKTELQFGRMRVTGIASQQRSEQESLQIQNGSTVQEFELRPDDYDENRHFFISHYHRDNFENALSNLPFINSLFRITRLEVWISDDRPNFQENSRTVVALSDIAEHEEERFSNPDIPYPPINPVPSFLSDGKGGVLPDNRSNELFENSGLVNDESTRLIEKTATNLRNFYDQDQTRDFEIFRGRQLSPSEYSWNSDLGFISLNIRLKPNQVLGVAYEYNYSLSCDSLYRVGELTDDAQFGVPEEDGETPSPSVLYVKMLKSTNQTIDHPTWDLMMKNVYSLRTSRLSEDDFQFDIFFEDDQGDGSLKKFIPEDGVRDVPLLNLFNLDRLNKQSDPQPDGIFDYVPGITVIPQNGALIFPVLEPFGSSLDSLLNDPGLANKYKFQALYDSTLWDARERLEKNKFIMKGFYKSNVSSEISLGAFNIPQGSVKVRAGSQELQEGVDYEVDYGIGRVRITNESYLQQGVPISVDYEDNTLFSLQQKTMFGLRFDYEAGKNLNLGATYMRLFERPFTEKVNIGDDPINNRVFGLDFDYNKDVPFVTKLVDKLPFYSTNQPSNLHVTGEFAAIKPGHSKAINLNGDRGGVVNIDDFEGAISGLPLGTQVTRWVLASTPGDLFEEGLPSNSDNLSSNYNRALLNWYVIDRGTRSNDDAINPYTRNINQRELFARDVPQGQLSDLFTFDLSYYPNERGPYNFDPPDGLAGISDGIEFNQASGNIELKNPGSRWAGIMRYMNNTDFQAANYESVEFWVLNPFIETDGSGNEHPVDEKGSMYIHFGNISEDILQDNLQYYENAIPVGNNVIPVKETNLADVPLNIPSNDAFDLQNRNDQDLGLDGANDAREVEKFQDYVNQVQGFDPSIFNDPSNDNFQYFLAPEVQGLPLRDRYKRFNNPEGNSPDGTRNERGNPYPDKEDLNNNKSLDQGESYFQYRIDIANDGTGELDTAATPYIREVRTIMNQSSGIEEKWYRIRVPLSDDARQEIGGINSFRSIQFMRLVVTGFESRKTFRMAEFELVRNQWRKLTSPCGIDGVPLPFTVDVVGREENTTKQPFGYILPRGIKQERLFSTFANVLQDEKSLSINFDNLQDSCEVSIYKLTEFDFRVFDTLQMFVHAERSLKDVAEDLQDKDLALFIRLGKDFTNNYYEYELPLTLSKEEQIGDANFQATDVVWPEENFVSAAFDWFTELKKLRNANGSNGILFEADETFNSSLGVPEGHTLSIIGNPTLGLVRDIQIGVRNISDNTPAGGFKGEVWVNELRAAGFKERGGIAALGRVDLQLADLGNLTVSGAYNSIGWGAIDQKLIERSLEENIEYDAAANLELGKFFPTGWGLSVPFYAQYAKNISNPLYDPYALDLEVEELIRADIEPDEEIRARSQDVTTIKTINFTNVRKQRSTGGGNSGRPGRSSKTPNKTGAEPKGEKSKKKNRKPMPWDISNFSMSYSYTETDHSDPILEIDNTRDYRGILTYDYNVKSKPIQPFKKVKGNYLKFIKELNFNPVPSSFSFSNELNRYITTRQYRLPTAPDPSFRFDDRRFSWNRRYDLNWDLTKALRMSFTANNEAVIDELRQSGIGSLSAWKDESGNDVTARVNSEEGYVDQYRKDNIRDFGRNTQYDHRIDLSYTLPFKVIPFLDWIDAKAKYTGDYNWTAGALVDVGDGTTPGAIIQNGQSRSLNGTFKFEKLYDKSKYLKKLNGKSRSRSNNSRTRRGEDKVDKEKKDNLDNKDSKKDRKAKKKDRPISSLEKVALRPIFMLKSAKFTYREDLGTVIPGYTLSPEYVGLSDGFSSPGWKFITGLQPDVDVNSGSNYLTRAASNGWITPSRTLNREVQQDRTQTLEANIELEPWKDFRVDIDFRKQYQVNSSQIFKNKGEDLNNPDFFQLAPQNMGSFEVTWFSLRTLFGGDQNAEQLFEDFLSTRSIVSNILQDTLNTQAGIHGRDSSAYAYGFGQYNPDVIIPAFLAVYTGRDIVDNNQSAILDLESDVSKLKFIPKPNWTLSYDGLSKFKPFSQWFKSFRLDHGYKSTLRVNTFNSDQEFDNYVALRNNGYDYFSRITIPQIVISEQFVPIIGLTVQTHNEMELSFNYQKTRELALGVTVNQQLVESNASEYTFGFGYVFDDVDFFTGKKKKRRGGSRSSRDKKEQEDKAASSNGGRRGVNNQKGNQLRINFDYSFGTNIQYRREYGQVPINPPNQGTTQANQGINEPVRGQSQLQISPAVEYDLNKNLTIRAFVDYTKTEPKGSSNSFPITSVRGGFLFQFKLD